MLLFSNVRVFYAIARITSVRIRPIFSKSQYSSYTIARELYVNWEWMDYDLDNWNREFI